MRLSPVVFSPVVFSVYCFFLLLLLYFFLFFFVLLCLIFLVFLILNMTLKCVMFHKIMPHLNVMCQFKVKYCHEMKNNVAFVSRSVNMKGNRSKNNIGQIFGPQTFLGPNILLAPKMIAH